MVRTLATDHITDVFTNTIGAAAAIVGSLQGALCPLAETNHNMCSVQLTVACGGWIPSPRLCWPCGLFAPGWRLAGVCISPAWRHTSRDRVCVPPAEQLQKLTGLSAEPEFRNKITFMALQHHPYIVVDTVRAYYYGLYYLVGMFSYMRSLHARQSGGV